METPQSPPIPEPVKGLPPVAPPSGRFIAQLFLVPGMIVLVAVLMLLAFRYLVGGGYSPDSSLKQLDSDNADIRWRGASDLAQVLKRPESMHLKSDAAFALDLAERLRSTLSELIQEEKKLHEKIAKLPEQDQQKAWKKLAALRDHARFLAAALGDFVIPVGVPQLCEIILHDDSPDVKGNTLRRRQAVWALANLGENTKGFKKLPLDKQAAILELLVQEADAITDRGVGARNALQYLDKTKLPPGNTAFLVEVDKVLAQAAKDDDRYLRLQVALALNFWDGPLVEPTLQMLARDNGHGTLVRIEEQD
ncbi:MAG: hypothetical protein L0Y72_31775 [Gemmataceae bacterium]|nr:hypothetical protein [Gemmataceae bacterium]MCI0743633.1 hypothetical protein [Gemmataceae bacterium]